MKKYTMYNSKRLENWILWKRFISLYKLVFDKLLIACYNKLPRFSCNSVFPHTSESGSETPFSNCHLVFLSLPLKTEKQVLNINSIYRCQKTWVFTNITRATTEEPGQTLSTFMMEKKKLVLKVAIMTGVTINTHYTCPSETKMRETLLWFCKVPR